MGKAFCISNELIKNKQNMDSSFELNVIKRIKSAYIDLINEKYNET